MPHSYKTDFSGQRFGRLIVKSFLPDDSKFSKWLCVCDCGNEKAIFMQSFVRGATQSCGCLHSEAMRARAKHGHNRNGADRTRTYTSWSSMMDRCHWGGHKIMFARYGARGITVDPGWHSFVNFLADMGERPAGTSIDRIDNAKGYGPQNCRWATRHEQAMNTSRTARVVLDGKEERVFELVDRLGLSRSALRSRAARRGNNYAAALQSFGIDARAIA